VGLRRSASADEQQSNRHVAAGRLAREFERAAQAAFVGLVPASFNIRRCR
jgi:hypothetical protein